MRATQQEARSQLVQRFADKFGEYDPAVVIDSLKAKTSGIRRAAGNRLEQVQNAMAGVNIQPARAIQQIDTEISNLQKLGKVADNETISKLQSYRDELVRNAGPDGPVNLDLKQLSDLRSQFRMDVKGERPVLPNRSDAAIQRVYKAMTDDINGAIGQNLGNDTLRKYQQANAVYADEAAKLKNTRLKNVLMKGDLTPEVVNNMLFSKNKSEIKTLYNSVGRVGRTQMRNGIIGKAMEKSGGSLTSSFGSLTSCKTRLASHLRAGRCLSERIKKLPAIHAAGCKSGSNNTHRAANYPVHNWVWDGNEPGYNWRSSKLRTSYSRL